MKFYKAENRSGLLSFVPVFLSVLVLTGCSTVTKEGSRTVSEGNSRAPETTAVNQDGGGRIESESPREVMPNPKSVKVMQMQLLTADRDFDVLATPNDGGKFVLKIKNGTPFTAAIRRTEDNWTYLKFDDGREGYTWSYPFIKSEN
jgi:uncharacterized protein YceK